MSGSFMKAKKKSKSTVSKAEQLRLEWEALLAKHSKPLERGAKAFNIQAINRLNRKPQPALEITVVAEKYKSLVTPGGSTALAEKKVYTGDKIIGIATMHKSNLVPIFNEQAAIDVAQMRRG